MGIVVARWITLISFLLWLVIYWQGGIKVAIDIKAAIRSRNSTLDIVLLILLTVCSLGMAGMAFLATLGWLRIVLLQNLAITSLGMFLSVLGILGMFYCRRHLGKFWTAETNLSRNHQIVDTGPYHFVRHPIYTFATLLYIGLGLTFLSWWNIALAGMIITAYILKAKDEDMFLEKKLPGYREYKSRVPARLLPGVW